MRWEKCLISLYDAKTNLSQLVDRAAAGEEIIIAKNGVPKARLSRWRAALIATPTRRLEGQGLDRRTHFDDPLPDDVLDAFEGRGDEPAC